MGRRMSDLAEHLARHIVSYPQDALPESVTDSLSLNLADALAVTLGGRTAPGVNELQQWLERTHAAGDARVFLSDSRLPAVAAAQINATAGHALDYDDTLDEGGAMHAGALVHNAVLAVADELGGVSGREYAAAVAVGLDVAARLALAATADFGWHRTSAFGVFGVTAAVARLLKLDETRTLNALGIAYSQASGNRQCIFDAATSKRLQAGFAARDGITAVFLAQAGLTGAHRIFEGANGFFKLYQRDAYQREVVLQDLGKTLLSDRISLKPYPCGRGAHRLLDAALAARSQHQGKTLQSIDVHLGQTLLDKYGLRQPRQVVEAQFSIPFSLALASIKGATSLHDYAAPLDAGAAVLALEARVTLHLNDDPSRQDWIDFSYTDASQYRATTGAVAYGHPALPLSAADIGRKLEDTNRFVGSPLKASEISALLEASLNLVQLESTLTLTQLLHGVRQP